MKTLTPDNSLSQSGKSSFSKSSSLHTSNITLETNESDSPAWQPVSQVGSLQRNILSTQPTRQNLEWKQSPGAEFVYHIEQTVNEESNWRTTWILETNETRAPSWPTIWVSPNNYPPRRPIYHQRQLVISRSSQPFPGRGWRQINISAE